MKIMIEPGYYTDLSIEDYHNSEGLSKSGIAKLLKSPRHYWHEYLNPNKPTKKRSDDFIIGDMLHTKLLEPEKLEERFCLAPLTDRRTKQGKQDYAQFLIESEGKTPCTMEMSYQVNCMEQSARSNKEFMSLVEDSFYEHSMYAIDPETGVSIKSRPDIIGKGYIADIKTSRDISKESFTRDTLKFGYDMQFSIAQLCYFLIHGEMIKNFFILAIEKEEPFLTNVYLLSDEFIHYGRKKMIDGLKIYKDCVEKNKWESEPETLFLPSWIKL